MLELVYAWHHDLVLEMLLDKELLLRFFDEVHAQIDVVDERQLHSLAALEINDDEQIQYLLHLLVSKLLNMYFVQNRT